MPFTLIQKLKIKEGNTILTINSPDNFEDVLAAGSGIKITKSAKNADQIHWFVTSKAQVKKEISKVMDLVKDNMICWIYFPKGTSKIKTDLSRDNCLDELDHAAFQFLTLVSFDKDWSAFAFRRQTTPGKLRENDEKKPISDYIDPEKRTVRIPEDLEKKLTRNKKQMDYFNTLAYSHKKEYVEWIVSAKKEETRTKRIDETIERLKKQWKNPSNN